MSIFALQLWVILFYNKQPKTRLSMTLPGKLAHKLDHAITATQKTILGAFGIDEADAKARALAIGKELMHAEAPEKEDNEYGTIEDDEID